MDYLLALERLEALRYAHFVKPAGTIIVNDHKVEPVRMGDERPYPEEGNDFLVEKGFNVVVVKATEKANELGNYRAANLILLGTLASQLDIPQAVWNETLEGRIPERLLSLNQQAFAAGQEMAPSGV